MLSHLKLLKSSCIQIRKNDLENLVTWTLLKAQDRGETELQKVPSTWALGSQAPHTVLNLNLFAFDPVA